MRINLRLLTAVLALSLCLTAVLANGASVHAINGLTVSPPLREVTIGPGLIETTADVTLQNNTNQSISAYLQLVDLRALGEYGGTSLDKAGLTGKYDLANWMTLPGGDTVIVASGETVKVRVKITNRDDLAPGGHYGAVVISTSSNNAVKSDVNINQQLVSLLFIKKLGGESYGLQLKSVDYKKSSNVPQEVTTTFKSTGNVHVVPRGYVEVTDPAGKLVAKGILNQDSSLILPGSERKFVTLMQPVSSASKPGKYKVTVYYRYDGQKDFSQQSSYFNRGPSLLLLRIIAVITGVIGVVIVLRVLKSKRKN